MAKKGLIKKIITHPATKIAGGVIGAAALVGAGVGIGANIGNEASAPVEPPKIEAPLPEDSTLDTPETPDTNIETIVVPVKTVYDDLLYQFTKKTKYNAEAIERIEVEGNKITIIATVTDNKNRTSSVYFETTVSEEVVATLNDSVSVAYEQKLDESYVEYLTSVSNVVKSSQSSEFTVGVYKQGKVETLDMFSAADIYSLMNAYYIKNNDKENAVTISNNYENADTTTISSAELHFVTGSDTCEVSATVGDIEMNLTFDVEENSTFNDVKEYVSDCIESYDVAEISGVEYSYNQHEKVIAEINRSLEASEETEVEEGSESETESSTESENSTETENSQEDSNSASV